VAPSSPSSPSYAAMEGALRSGEAVAAEALERPRSRRWRGRESRGPHNVRRRRNRIAFVLGALLPAAPSAPPRSDERRTKGMSRLGISAPLAPKVLLLATLSLGASCGVVPAAVSAPAWAAQRGPVEFVRAVDDQPTKKRSVRVAIRVTRPMRSVRAFLERREVNLRSAGPRGYRGVAGGLRPERNVVRVEAVTRAGRSSAAFIRVIHAPRVRGLVGVRAARRGSSPLSVAAVVPHDEVRFRAWLNGHRIDRRFAPEVRGVRRASLSASDHLKFGRNRLRVHVIADRRLRDRARYYSGTFNDNWSATRDGLRQLSFDADEAAGKFTAADLTAVVNQLITELNLVDNVNGWYRDMRGPLVDDQGHATAEIAAIAQDTINAAQPPKSSDVMKWVFFGADVAFGALGLGKGAEPLAVVGEAAAGAAELATESPAGDPITCEIQTTASQIAVTMTGNVRVTLDAMERMREIVLSDSGKLYTVGTLVENGGPWHATGDGYNTSLHQLDVGVVRQTHKALLPAIGKVFQVFPAMAWSLNNRHIDDIVDFRCRRDFIVPGSGKPFGYSVSSPTHRSQPASAQVKLELWPENHEAVSAQTYPRRSAALVAG
jgi:hypothetical protein